MYFFTYTSRHKDGKKIQGVIKARDRIDVIRRLERAGCIPLTINEQTDATCVNGETRDTSAVSGRKNKGTVFVLSFVFLGLLGWLTVSRLSRGDHLGTRPPLLATAEGHKSNRHPVEYPVSPSVPENRALFSSTPTQEVMAVSLVEAIPEKSKFTPPLEEDARKLVRWSLGVAHADFGMSADQFHKAIQAAIKNWEDAAGVQIFEYDPKKGMPINLVITEETIAIKKMDELTVELDKMQEKWGKLNVQWEGLNAQWQEMNARREALKGQWGEMNARREALEGQWDVLEEERLELKAKYDLALKNWVTPHRRNDEKSYAWLCDSYRRLQELRVAQNGIRTSMKMYSGAMEKIIDQMNEYVDPLNIIGAELNLTADQQNKNSEWQGAYIESIEKFNNAKLELGHFGGSSEVGQDNKKYINIFWLKNNSDLILTITHELGHAIGFYGHVTDPFAIMYPSSSSAQTITQQDLDAIYPCLKYRNLMR